MPNPSPNEAILANPQRLAVLRETGLLDTPATESLDCFARIARTAIGAPASVVTLIDEHRQFFTSQCGLGEPLASQRGSPLSHSFCQHVVLTAEPLIVSDSRAHPRLRGNPAITELSVIAYAGMPIRIPGREQILGSFCVIDTVPREWTQRELEILRDLTELVGAEIGLRRRTLLAERSEVELQELVSDLSQSQNASARATRDFEHDIRSPLGVITMAVAGLLRHEGARGFPEMTHLLEILDRNARHAAAMAGHLGVASTGRTGAVLALGSLVDEVCADLRSRAPRIEIAVKREGTSNVTAHPSDVRRCVENLIGNAQRFARSKVEVRITRRDDMVSIAVGDDGPGLPTAGDYERAWDRTTRLHEATGQSGSGLGLSIVRAIATRQGGGVFSGPSEWGGASFGFALPAVG